MDLFDANVCFGRIPEGVVLTETSPPTDATPAPILNLERHERACWDSDFFVCRYLRVLLCIAASPAWFAPIAVDNPFFSNLQRPDNCGSGEGETKKDVYKRQK